MVKGSLPPLLFCGRLFWAWLRVMQQVKQPDWLLCRPQLFCDRVWLLVKKPVQQQAKKMRRFRLVTPSFELSCACDVLPVLLRATRPGLAIALAQRKNWQVLLQKRKQRIFWS